MYIRDSVTCLGANTFLWTGLSSAGTTHGTNQQRVRACAGDDRATVDRLDVMCYRHSVLPWRLANRSEPYSLLELPCRKHNIEAMASHAKKETPTATLSIIRRTVCRRQKKWSHPAIQDDVGRLLYDTFLLPRFTAQLIGAAFRQAKSRTKEPLSI